jgi:hypothetical protein
MFARIFAAATILALAAVPALAQPKDKEPKAKVKVYDFSGDTIEGDLIKPEGDEHRRRRLRQALEPHPHPPGLHRRDPQVGRRLVIARAASPRDA